ncbi:hypothetical protein D3C72_1547880 [compost metagenome]
MVRLTERHAFGDQIIRQFGRVGVALLCRFLTTRTFHLDAIQHQRRHLQTVHPGIQRVEQPFLVFLHIFVVRQRQAFQRHHHARQCALYTPAFTADQLQRIRVFLLRHQRGAGSHAVGQIDKGRFAAVEEDQVFGKARQVHHADGGVRQQFQHVVTIRNAVQAITGCRSKAQPTGQLLTVDRVRSAGQCATAQRADVQAFQRILQAAFITRQHFNIGQTPVREGHRLRTLQVGITRHHRILVGFGGFHQRLLQLHDGLM